MPEAISEGYSPFAYGPADEQFHDGDNVDEAGTVNGFGEVPGWPTMGDQAGGWVKWAVRVIVVVLIATWLFVYWGVNH